MSKRFTAAITLVLSLIAAGCGTATVQRRAADPGARPRASCAKRRLETAGLKTYTLREAGFRIGLPQEWTAMTAGGFGDALDETVAKNPSLARYQALLTAPHSPFKLVAIACGLRDGVPSTLTIIAIGRERHGDWRFSAFERGALRAMRDGAVSGTTPAVDDFDTPTGRAVRIRALTNPPGLSTPASTTTYLVQTRTTAYIIGYSTAPELARKYEDLFDRSVRSFREL